MSNQPNTLLEEAIDAHGGLDRWRGYKGIASTIISGGRLWDIKGTKIVSTPRRATSEFRRQWTQVTPFGDPDWTMTWSPEHVEITDGKGTILAQRDNGRYEFERSYDAPWDPLNLAYFNGYAMWTYHAAPFVFAEPGYEAREIEPIANEGEMLRGSAFASQRTSTPILASSVSISAPMACCDAMTMRWTSGRTRPPRTSCRTTSTSTVSSSRVVAAPTSVGPMEHRIWTSLW